MPSSSKLATLHSSQEINAIRKEGRSFSNRYIVLTVTPNALQESRFAVIATRSVGGAVERNRCKRRIRSRVKKFAPGIIPGYDFLVIARFACLEVEPTVLDSAFEKIFTRAELLAQVHSG